MAGKKGGAAAVKTKRAAKTKIANVRFPNTKHKEHFPNLPKRKPNTARIAT